MSQQYRKRGQIDVYEPVPTRDYSWVGWFLVVMFVILLLSRCSH